MELLLIGIGVGLAAGLVKYRSLGGLARNSLRGELTIVLVLFVQVLVPMYGRSLGLGDAAITTVWVLMSTCLLFLALANSTRFGMVLAGIGLAMNIIVVAANGGMPVDFSSAGGGLTSSATTALAESPIHVAQSESTRLSVLGDRIPVPLGPSRRALVSIGDVVLAAGAMLVMYQMIGDAS